MNTSKIPPLRDLPAGRLAARQHHLLAEITQPPERRQIPHVAVALGSGAACVGAAIAVIAITLTGGSGSSESPYFVQGSFGPEWSTHGRVALCTSEVELPLYWCKDGEAPARRKPMLQPSEAFAAETEILGGTEGQRDVLQSIVEGMRPTTITRIELVPSSGRVTLWMRALDASDRTYWMEELVAGAFRDRSKAAGSPVTVALKNWLSNGAVLPPGPPETLPPAEAGAAEAARQTFEDAAAEAGATPDDLTIYQPDGVAVAITFRSADPAAFLVDDLPAFLAGLGDYWHDYDGVYVALVDESGSTVWNVLTVARNSTGGVGAREDLLGCSPIGVHGASPPPCPAE